MEPTCTAHEKAVLKAIATGTLRTPAGVAQLVWPDRSFRSPQGAARAISPTITRLVEAGLIWKDTVACIYLTAKGREYVTGLDDSTTNG